MSLNLNITLAEYAKGVHDGSISCEEFVSATLERIAERDETLHAFVSIDASSIEEARKVDTAIKDGHNVGALAGAPIGIKDNICVAGQRTTCCSWMLQDYVSPYDATVISRMRKAGGIALGKTNMDEFAMGLTTEFAAFGPSRNPWNNDCVPGGSSGGSAVAVSALECMIALGSDTGGSVRNPASFCGVVGYKPTYGMLSRYGLVSYANSIEQVGIMTRSVADVDIMMGALSGPDSMDDTARLDYATCPGPAPSSESNLDGIVVGVDADAVDDSGNVGSAMRRAASALESAGAKVVDVKIEQGQASVAAYYVITAAEAGSNLARYDNLRYGYDLSHEGYEYNAYISHARSRFGPEVTRRMILGGFVPSAGKAGKYYLKALKVRDALGANVDKVFAKETLSCVLSPTVPVLPFKFGEKIDDPVELFRMDSNTVMANLTGRPSVSVPFASSNGLPIGAQLTGALSCDREMLVVASALEAKSEFTGAES